MNRLSIAWSCEHGVGVLLIDRIESRNALDLAAYALIAERLAKVDADPNVRVVVISGRADPARSTDDQSFCAGFDVKEMGNVALDPRPDIDDVLSGLVLSTPLIAAVDGWCVGGGMALLMLCDHRIASTSSRFRLPELRYRVLPAYGSLTRLVREVGWSRALDLVLIGEDIDARTAFEWGLLNALVEPGTVLDEARRRAARMAEHSKLALQSVKRIARSATDMALHDAVMVERSLQAALADHLSRTS